MKKLIFICLIAMLAFTTKAQSAKALNSYISYATFNVAEAGVSPYVETYITFDRGSLVYMRNADGQYQATINITVLFKQDESIKNYGKYTLNSPAVLDTTAITGFFMDMQRYQLANGTYTLEVTLEDENNKAEKPFKIEDQLIVDFPEKICFSSIIGLESFSKAETESACTKSGFDLIPMTIPYYPETSNKLSYYCEIYNSKKQLGNDEKYLLNTYISAFENGTKLSNFFITKRMSTKDTEVILGTMDITNLPSGNYYLVLEARDRNNEIIGLNRFFFQRSNPNYHVDELALQAIDTDNIFSGKITSIDSLRKYIVSCYPLATQVEKEYAEELIKTDNVKTMQQYFYTFWSSRNSIEPEKAWNQYLAQVHRCDASFKSINQPGSRTDRGVIFLRYGAPDRIVQEYNEPGAYPYEIWHYYTLGSQRNKKFVFMTRDLATNDFELIHSDAVGEVNNFRWTTEIYSRTYGSYFDYSVDGVATPNSYGDKAKDYYDTPR